MKRFIAVLFFAFLAYQATAQQVWQPFQAAFSNLTGSATCAQLPALTGDVSTGAGSCTTAVASVPAGATITDPIDAGTKVDSGAQTFTSNATLTALNNLSVTITAAKTYACMGHINVTASNASGGAKITLTVPSGTLTSHSWATNIYNAGTVLAGGSVAGMGTGQGITGVVTGFDFNATFVNSTATSVIVQGAQNASFATGTTFGADGSFLKCWRTN